MSGEDEFYDGDVEQESLVSDDDGWGNEDDENAFGDFSTTLALGIPQRRPFRFRMTDIKPADFRDPDDPKMRPFILSFEIVDNGNPDDLEYIEMAPGDWWINFWPGLREEEFKAMNKDQKLKYNRHRQFVRLLARAFGFSEEQAKTLTPRKIKELVGRELIAKCYEDRQGTDRIDPKTLAPVNKVEA